MLYLQSYLEIASRGRTCGGCFFNCTKNTLIVLCWKSQKSELSVDFKIESVFQARRKKIKFYIYLANEEMGAAKVDR